MASVGEIQLKVSTETYEIFMASRLTACQAFSCKNLDLSGDCKLKRIYIGERGQCAMFDEEDAEDGN